MKRREFLTGAAALSITPRIAWGQEQQAVPLPPGVVIAHSSVTTGRYLGSPSITILPDGTYLASHDDFGPKGGKDTTWLYASRDRGAHWKRLSTVEGQVWSSLFWHRGALYLLSPGKQRGPVKIHRSDNGGKTWSVARDGKSGLLRTDGEFHSAPVPVVVHNGRIWRACEVSKKKGGRIPTFRTFIMSAPEDSDLLRAENWTYSNDVGGDSTWLKGKFGGWLEGNAVVTPEGNIVNIIRVNFRDRNEKAAILTLSADGKTLNFDPQNGFIDFPGGCKKFTIRRDPQTKEYWTLSNWIPPKQKVTNVERTRNTLALVRSSDLVHWEVRSVLLYHPDAARHGFQYADWQFDGNDIIAAVRTAFDDSTGGAHNCHDSNFMTFHRFANFRHLTLDNLPTGLR